jgi:hypothetical protein
MSDYIDSTVKDIDSRLHELRQEVDRLMAARAALLGGTKRGPGRPPSLNSGSPAEHTAPVRKRARTGRPGGRRSGGTRANQALDLVRSQPGITIPQIAEAIKIEPNYLYRVMPKLMQDGEVKREGLGFYPSGSSGANEAAVEELEAVAAEA